MKKYYSLVLFLTLSLGILGLSGCGSDEKTEVNDSASKTVASDSNQLSDELAHHAYDAIFSLSFATLEAGAEGNGITVQEDETTSTYSFDNVSYLKDIPEATVKGYMKAINGETTDQSEVSFDFTGDPDGLKSITIKSSGPHGETHTEGTLVINGTEKPFMEFVDYFASKFNQEVSAPSAETLPTEGTETTVE